MRMVKYLDPSVEKYIKSKKALVTLDNLIGKIEEFNSEENPFEIVRVGVGGSVWRKENPRDVDVVIFYDLEDEFKDEFLEYQKFLRKLTPEEIALMHNLKEGMHWEVINGREEYVKRKVKMADFIEENKYILLEIGFKEVWLEWMKYQKISQVFLSGVLGIFFRFKPDTYIKMKIKEKLSKKIRVGIEAYFIQNYDEKTVIPHIVIWENGKCVKITEGVYKEHLKREWNTLINQFSLIENILKNPDSDIQEEIPVGVYRHTIEIYTNIYGVYNHSSPQLKKYVDAIRKDIHQIINSNASLEEKIKQLRFLMKKMRIVGDVIYKVYGSRLVWEKVIPDHQSSSSSFRDFINNYILKYSADIYARKEDVKPILEEFDFTVVVDDLRDRWKRIREEMKE